MSEIRICTLVLEYNYSRPGASLGSVWLFNGDGTSSLSQSSPLDTLPNWVKVAGPVDYDLANTIHGNLKRFFEHNGVSVIDEGIAD